MMMMMMMMMMISFTFAVWWWDSPCLAMKISCSWPFIVLGRSSSGIGEPGGQYFLAASNCHQLPSTTSSGFSLQTKTSWWLNQPHWNICSSNWIISPRIGMKIYLQAPPRRPQGARPWWTQAGSSRRICSCITLDARRHVLAKSTKKEFL